jgi:hypothetical protein
MSTYNQQLQKIFDRYNDEVEAGPVSLEDVAGWAISKGLFSPTPRDVVKLCREALAESLRQERRVDEKGRKYRAKHSVRTSHNGVQMSLWADIDHAPKTFMEKSFAQRRRSIVDDCFQIKQDVDHFNDLHPDDLAIQMVLDFADDVAELEATQRLDKPDSEAA